MANEQHIAWLLEGAEAWNARREKEDFVPDFEGADLREADLRGAKLREAKLLEANLLEANLREADLRGADLRGAKLLGANLREAKLLGANLRGANVTTVVYSGLGINDGDKPEYTDVSQTKGLSQPQLNSMKGDSGTIIPEGLERPEHWPELEEALPELVDEDGITDGNHTEPANQAANQIALQDQVSVILDAPVKHAAAAELLNDQLDSAILMFRAANQTNEQPDDLILVERFSDKLREIRRVLDQPGEAQAQALETRLPELLAIIDNLRATIEDQAEQIETLKAQKTERTDFQRMRSAFAISFGTALGAGTAATVISAGDALLGNYGASTVQQLRDAFGSFFGATPPTPPPQLPPVTPT